MKLFAERLTPLAPTRQVLKDTEHAIGKSYRVTITIGHGHAQEVVECRAGQPGLACNRAWKLYKAQHKTRARIHHVLFEVEVR